MAQDEAKAMRLNKKTLRNMSRLRIRTPALNRQYIDIYTVPKRAKVKGEDAL